MSDDSLCGQTVFFDEQRFASPLRVGARRPQQGGSVLPQLLLARSASSVGSTDSSMTSALGTGSGGVSQPSIARQDKRPERERTQSGRCNMRSPFEHGP